MKKRFIKVVLFVPAILIAIALFITELVYFAVSCPSAYIIFADLFKFDIGKRPWNVLFWNWFLKIDK